MKRISIVIIFIGLLSGCTKFLDKVPEDYVLPDNYYKTSQDLSNALNGVYDILGKVELYGNFIPIQLNIGTDEAFYPLVGAAGVLANQFDPSDATINSLWNSTYSGIDRANLLLERIDGSNADSATKSIIRGEALFLRAYYHFVLVSLFGDIPMKLTSTLNITDVSQKRTPSNEIYTQITKDMMEAEGRVRSATQVKNGGHINKSAVRGILARVYLYWSGYPLFANKYDQVLKWALLVNQNNEHSLNNDYRQIFINYAQDKYDIKESIWEVEFFYPGINSYSEGGRLGNINGVQCANLDSGYSYGQMNGTMKLFNSYGGTLAFSQDNRRDWAMANYKLTGVLPNIKTPITSTTIYDRNAAKWRREYEPYTSKDKNFTNENFPILRYSDVLLMIAEADNELNGPTLIGINAINSIRERAYKSIKTVTVTTGGSGYTSIPSISFVGGGGAGATAYGIISGGQLKGITLSNCGYGYTSSPSVLISGGGGGIGATAYTELVTASDADLTAVQTGDKDAFRQVIREERMRELCFEGHRRFDLIRWGNYIKYMNDYASTIVSVYPLASIAGLNLTTRNTYLPIPSSELSVNKLAVQNFGY